MKFTKVSCNNKKKVFDVRLGTKDYSYPYAKTAPMPTTQNPITAAYPDKELGRKAFTYVLRNGAEGTVHADHVLEYNRDPKFMLELFTHNLSAQVRKRLAESDFSKREMSRRLGTSPTQLYRLLDPGRTSKSIPQLLSILHTMDYAIDLVIKKGGEQGRVGWSSPPTRPNRLKHGPHARVAL